MYLHCSLYIRLKGDVWLHTEGLGLPLTSCAKWHSVFATWPERTGSPHKSHCWKFPWTLQHALKIKAPRASHIWVGSGNYSALVLPRIHYLGPNCTNLTDINSNCSGTNPLHNEKCTGSMFEQVPWLKTWENWTWVFCYSN